MPWSNWQPRRASAGVEVKVADAQHRFLIKTFAPKPNGSR
jgi:hypothetical protein